MNIDEATEIKDKILQNEEYGGIAGYVENILNHKEFIEQDKNSADNVRYLYDILRDIGYMRMRNYGLNESLMNEIEGLFCLKLPDSENNAPTLFFFEDLFDEVELYQNLMQNIEPAPNAGEKPEKEEIWESRRRNLKNCGLKLVFSGFDITAVMLGSKLLLAATQFSEEWKQSWKVFSDNANKYLKKLYKLKGQMPSIAERIRQELAEYNMPDGEFSKFASEIAVIHKSWSKNNYFRYILKSEKVDELYQKAKHIFQEYPPAARIYFFKNALAEETLKHFIQNGCISLLTNDETLQTNSKWSLQGTLNGEPVKEAIIVVPMLYAGKKEKYSVHMLGPRVSGWGIRCDRLRQLLFNDEKYKGAFFCSWKEYPTEEILVRFDRFIPKARFKELTDGAQDFIRLPVNTVLKEKDLREEVLQEAAEAVMGLETQPGWVREFLKQLSSDIKRIFVSAPERIRDGAIDLLGKIPDIREPGFTIALAPARAMADEQEDNYYVPVKSLKNTTFLDPDPDSIFSNRSVSEAVNRGFDNNWQYIWLFIDTKANIIDGVHGPLEISGEGEKNVDVPDHAECVWFFIGPPQTVNKIKTECYENKTLKITKQEKLYWIIYGPEK